MTATRQQRRGQRPAKTRDSGEHPRAQHHPNFSMRPIRGAHSPIRGKTVDIGALEARRAELKARVAEKTEAFENGEIKDKAYFEKWITKAHDEYERLNTVLDNVSAAKKAYARAEKVWEESDGMPELPEEGFAAHGGVVSGATPLPVGGSALPSPRHMTGAQVKTLFKAVNERRPVTVEIPVKPQRQPLFPGMRQKAGAPVLESTLGGGFVGQLPPVQTPFSVGIGYELTRVAGLFPGAMMPGPSATWLSHTANAYEPTGVPEGTTKPNIGPVITENQVIPQKIAATVDFSLEAWQDTGSYGEAAFASWLPVELERAVWNAESLYLLQATTESTNPIAGGPVSATFNGILNTSGTLTRAVASGESPLDTLSQAFNDIRVGPAFSWPDLMLVHPTTYNALRLIKDSEGRYVMNLLAGPLGLTADGSAPVYQPALEANVYSITPQGSSPFAGHLWGVPVALTTQCPEGTAIVTSVAAGGGMYWTRLAMLIMFNMWSGNEWENNLQSFRAEERIALSVQRPTAVNIVTGLPS